MEKKRREFLNMVADMLTDSGESFVLYSANSKGTHEAILGNINDEDYLNNIYNLILETANDEKYRNGK